MKTLIVLGVGLLVGMSTAQSQTVKTEKEKDQTATVECTYADKNNDGVCDYHATNHQQVKGYAYVDKNNDGVCDNHGTHRNGYRNGHHRGHNHGNGYGYGHRYGQKSDE